MGTECFNGNNNDIDIITINSKGNKTINTQMKQNNLNFRNFTQKKISEPIHFQTQFQEYQHSIYRSQQHYYNRHIYKKDISDTPRTNSLKLINHGKEKKIHNFTNEELEDQVNDILRIRIPFFENGLLKTLSAFTFLSGNGPYHEGLMFFTTRKNFYIAQSYPITFIKVTDFNGGISELISFNNFNRTSKKYVISEIYSPQEPIPLSYILKIINDLPNKYNLLNDNCQDFCNNVLNALKKDFNIEMDDNKNITKINFIKKQKKNIFKTANYKFSSGRFDNL